MAKHWAHVAFKRLHDGSNELLVAVEGIRNVNEDRKLQQQRATKPRPQTEGRGIAPSDL